MGNLQSLHQCTEMTGIGHCQSEHVSHLGHKTREARTGLWYNAVSYQVISTELQTLNQVYVPARNTEKEVVDEEWRG